MVRVTDKLSEVRSQKVKFSRLVREKGEEIGERVSIALSLYTRRKN